MQREMGIQRIIVVVLTVLVCILLVVNGFLIASLLRARAGALDALAAARSAVADIGGSPIVSQVAVDQTIPLSLTLPIDQEVTIPLKLDYPLSTVVNTGFDIPLLGRQEVAIPIEANIPINYNLTVPIRLTVPISFAYRLQTELPVAVELPAEIRTVLDQMLQTLESSLR